MQRESPEEGSSTPTFHQLGLMERVYYTQMGEPYSLQPMAHPQGQQTVGFSTPVNRHPMHTPETPIQTPSSSQFVRNQGILLPNQVHCAASVDPSGMTNYQNKQDGLANSGQLYAITTTMPDFKERLEKSIKNGMIDKVEMGKALAMYVDHRSAESILKKFVADNYLKCRGISFANMDVFRAENLHFATLASSLIENMMIASNEFLTTMLKKRLVPPSMVLEGVKINIIRVTTKTGDTVPPPFKKRMKLNTKMLAEPIGCKEPHNIIGHYLFEILTTITEPAHEIQNFRYDKKDSSPLDENQLHVLNRYGTRQLPLEIVNFLKEAVLQMTGFDDPMYNPDLMDFEALNKYQPFVDLSEDPAERVAILTAGRTSYRNISMVLFDKKLTSSLSEIRNAMVLPSGKFQRRKRCSYSKRADQVQSQNLMEMEEQENQGNEMEQ